MYLSSFIGKRVYYIVFVQKVRLDLVTTGSGGVDPSLIGVV